VRANDVKATRWVVESLGESTASVEVDGEKVEKVPRWLLPADAREGEVLAVERTHSGDHVSLTVRRDPKGTRAALEASKEQLARAPKDTKGGDITL